MTDRQSALAIAIFSYLETSKVAEFFMSSGAIMHGDGKEDFETETTLTFYCTNPSCWKIDVPTQNGIQRDRHFKDDLQGIIENIDDVNVEHWNYNKPTIVRKQHALGYWLSLTIVTSKR
jgi:hypothetical protein